MPLLTYSVKAAVLLAAFYLPYRFLLRNTTLHGLKRAVLAVSVVLASVLPCVSIRAGVAIPVLDGITEAEAGTMAYAASHIGMLVPALAVVYFAGAALCLIRELISILTAFRIVRRSETVRREGWIRISVTDEDVVPFSWMNRICIPRKIWESGAEAVILHERAHVRRLHSLDVSVFNFMACLQWFNPVIGLYRKEMRAIHEFQADETVVSSGMDVRQYCSLLVRSTYDCIAERTVCSFSRSCLDRRFSMLHRERTPWRRALCALYVLPVAALALLVNYRSDTVIYYSQPPEQKLLALVSGRLHQEKSGRNSTAQLSEFLSGYDDFEQMKDKTGGFNSVKVISGERPDALPSFEGGSMLEYSGWLNSQLAPFVQRTGALKTVQVAFTINRDGEVKGLRVFGAGRDVPLESIIRLAGNGQRWTPAMSGGKPVEVTVVGDINVKI